jgi:hypothetical protein
MNPLTGAEELLLVGTGPLNTALALALTAKLVQLAQPYGDAPVAWAMLPVSDLEALLLVMRQVTFGDQLRAEAHCANPTCRARIDVDFSITEYLAHHLPRPYRTVEPDAEAGWFRLQNDQARFRLPTVADQLAVEGSATAARELARRCIDPPNTPARVRSRIERALAVLAPSLSDEVETQCPECGQHFAIFFNVKEFILRELRDQARYLLDDIHLIACYYHWSEDAILALPRVRRLQYAERIRLGFGNA